MPNRNNRTNRVRAPQRSPEPPTSQTSQALRISRLKGALLVALLAAVVYLPALRNGFALDAVHVVEDDARVHSLSDPWAILTGSYWPPSDRHESLYRPLVTLSFAVEWALFDGSPAGFHFMNVLAHALASALLFLLLATLAPLGAALAGAALFAVHPVHVEAVATIVGRADIYVAIGTLAAALLWQTRPANSLAVQVGTAVLFAGALASKEGALMMPALLILIDVAAGRLNRARVGVWLRERAVTLAGIVLAAAVLLMARWSILGTVAPHRLDPIIAVMPDAAARIRTSLQVWPDVVRLLIVPWTLLADYGPRTLLPALTWTPRALIGAMIFVGAIGGGVFALLRGRGRLGLALLWVPIAMLLVSNLIVPIGVILAERTLYLPSVAVAVGAATAVDVLSRRGVHVRTLLAVCAAVCVLYGVRTVARVPEWHSTDAVFRALLRDRPDSFHAHWQNARMAWRDGEIPAARDHYMTAVDLWPYAPELLHEASTFTSQLQLYPETRALAAISLEKWPDDVLMLRRMAVSSLMLHDTAGARAAVARGLRLAPDDQLFNMMRAAIR